MQVCFTQTAPNELRALHDAMQLLSGVKCMIWNAGSVSAKFSLSMRIILYLVIGTIPVSNHKFVFILKKESKAPTKFNLFNE